MERESFIFYRSFYEAVDSLPLENQAHIYKAIASYALNGEIIELNQWENALFKTIRPQLDANQKRFENGCKGAEYGKLGAEYGKLGGRPKKDNPPNNPPKTPQNPPNNPPNDNVNDNDNDNELKKESIKKEKCTSLAVQSTASHTIRDKRFMKPTLEEVQAYCEERGNFVDPQRFIDYYTAKGWKIGKSPMKDWRAAVRTWERNDAESAGQRRKGSREDPMLECLARLYAEADEEDRRNAEANGH